ncbi:hypothetical protein AOQ84DRAFT_378986 [Glonium stellatum]|uniref:Uncharacterized protein n=1 Tax=Glonium stellatum TaxID=574774 RepID=A0A8E2JQS5_9PEZI|nr:hypothetical protein AOQ84DRAFT_378986 [Glonium stellatum]
MPTVRVPVSWLRSRKSPNKRRDRVTVYTWLAAIPSYLAAAHYCSRGWTAVVLLMAPVVLGFIPGPGSSGTTVRFALTPILLWLCSQPGVSPASTIIPPT